MTSHPTLDGHIFFVKLAGREPPYIMDVSLDHCPHQEKAEKWEKLQNSELLHDIIVNASKLEAFKEWYNYIYSDSDVPLDDFRFPEDSMVRFKKILEAEDR